ncbi:hypothetical protein ACLI1A_08685 [Flavobacterium sp. RHBU_3]|uniref:hypothetical protein n=1 Tax=Flavobacterium sp. RHBU_3 TaxID=3391184 RepID=UPI0039850F98
MKRILPGACILLAAVATCCADKKNDTQHIDIEEIATLHLKEVSGLEYVNGTLWAQEDSGNNASLYIIDQKTGKHTEVPVTNAKNNDWEDLAADEAGNLYVGDFGNNENDRTNLAIYALGKPGNEIAVTGTTTFNYPEQKDFPAKKKDRNFDCEAFFEYKGNFYLFSKNRCVPADDIVKVRKVSKTGATSAVTIGSFSTCDNFRKCAIAGADISPDGKTIALVSGSKLWLITGYKGDDFAHGTIQSYDLGKTTQKEAVCFTDNKTLLVADEKDKKDGGKLYRIKL